MNVPKEFVGKFITKILLVHDINNIIERKELKFRYKIKCPYATCNVLQCYVV